VKQKLSVIGKRLPRVDARSKATGEAVYTIDMQLPKMLHGKILRSPHAHARILNIDASRAERLPGVKGVITWKDLKPEKKSHHCYGAFIPDEYPLAIDRVRFIGDEVAAVAAVDEETARQALDLIQVDYEPLEAVFNPETALRDGAPQLHEHAENNKSWRLYQDLGDVEHGFEEAYHIQEDRFVTHFQCHGPLEPHATVAQFETDGKLTVWSSTQRPFFVSWDLAQAMDMPESSVRVIKPHVGGGFGGKIETASVEYATAFLARKTGRPVKIVHTREEEFATTRRRHALVFYLKTGVREDGTITARTCRSIMDGGAYNSLGIVTCYLTAIFLNLPYKNPNIRYEALRVYTNNPPCGAMRGFGAPQTHFAVEVQLDMIAEALGMDPMELRLKNSLKSGDETPSGIKIRSCGLPDCIKTAAKKANWHDLRKQGGKGTGIGLACNGFISGPRMRRLPRLADAYAFSAALIRAHGDGRVTLLTGSADIGQGSDSILAQIAAEVLGISYESVSVLAGDTEVTPLDLGTYGSRVTMMAGHATRNAAGDLRQKIVDASANQLEANSSDVEIEDGIVFIKGAPEKNLSFSDAVIACQQSVGGKPVIGEGFYNPEEDGILNIKALVEKGIGNYSPAYSFGAHIAGVQVDEQTGEINVKNVVVAHDCGVAINPMAVEGQLEGAVAMGHGYALTESVDIDSGMMLNPNYLDYKLPLSVDLPPTEIHLVETNDPKAPLGAKEAGEGPISPAAPSIVNAVHHATGIWMKELPITPAKVLEAIKSKYKEEN
jgi:4-hydroxybenzoyl-CoA reductase subunit alpha